MVIDIREAVTHPIATATAVFAVVGGVLNVPFIDALWSVVWVNAGNLFTVLSVTGFTLAPRVPWLPTEELTIAALVVGGLYVVTKLDQLLDALRARLRRNQE